MDTKKIEQIVASINQIVLNKRGKSLKDIQVDILRGAFKQEEYVKIALANNRSPDSIKKEASLLWKLLSEVFGETITKTRLEVLKRKVAYLSVYHQFSNSDQDWADAPDVSSIVGRETDLNTLKQWVVGDRCRLVTIVGLPGKGKTSLTVKLAQEVSGEFEGVIWRSLLNSLSIQDLIKDWILFFSHQQKMDLPERIDQQINLLISYLKQHRYLLILDNIETILAKETQFKNYKSGYEDYYQLLEKIAQVPHQSCLLLTSRVKIHHLEKFVGQHQPVRCFVVGGLTVEPVKQLFQEKGEFTATETEWETLVNFYQGNPLALKLTACHIQNLFSGNIQDLLKFGNLVFQDIQDLLDLHFQYCSPEEHNVLFWLAIYREPVSIAELKKHVVSVNIQQHLLDYLESLENQMLLEKTANQQCFTLQPVLMEYVTEKLITTVTPELITGDSNGYIHFLNPEDGQPILSFGKHKWWTVALAFNSDGEKLVSSSLNPTVKIWNAKTGQLLKDLEGHKSWVWTVAFSPDNQIIASGSDDKTIKFWDANNGQLLRTLDAHNGWVLSVAFSPNGRMLAIGSDDQTIKLWDMKTGDCLQTLRGRHNKVRSIAFSPDGQFLVSGSDDYTVKLWDLKTGNCLYTLLGHEGWVWSVDFSPDGHFLASGSDDYTVKLWDFKRGKCLYTLKKHTHTVTSVMFTPDRQILLSSSEDGTIKFWQVKTGKGLKTLIIPNSYTNMNITGTQGLSEGQKHTLKALGAIEN